MVVCGGGEWWSAVGGARNRESEIKKVGEMGFLFWCVLMGVITDNRPI